MSSTIPNKKVPSLSGKFVIITIFLVIGVMSSVLYWTMSHSTALRSDVSHKINDKMISSLDIQDMKIEFPNLPDIKSWNLEMQGYNFLVTIPKGNLDEIQTEKIKTSLINKVQSWLKSQFPDGKELNVNVVFN